MYYESKQSPKWLDDDGRPRRRRSPEIDGLEATRQIRAPEGPGPRIRILAMTAHSMSGDRERCLAAGMDGYLSKPIQPAELFAVLESGHSVAV